MAETIGRDPSCDVVLDSPLVSRLHATLEGNLLVDPGSANGTFVEGQPIAGGEAYLKKGQRVTIGPYHLLFDGQRLQFMGRGLRVTCRKVTFRIPRGNIALLQDIDLDVPPGTFLALVGTSGAGKSAAFSLDASLSQLISSESPRSAICSRVKQRKRLSSPMPSTFSARGLLPFGSSP